MALPASPTNGQVSIVNGVSYIYDSATNSLTRTSSGTLSLNSANISTSTTTGALTVAGGAGIAGNVFAGGDLTYGTVPIFNSSTTVTSIGTAPVAVAWFGNTAYRSAKYVVSTTDVTNSQYQTVEVVLVQNGTTSTISSYGEVTSGASTRMTFTSNVMSGNVILWAIGVSANNTIKLVSTLIPA
jgi:hypothetical protein